MLSSPSSRSRRRMGRVRPRLETLEDRALLSTVFWNVDTDGFWDVASNWRDDQGQTRLPAPADDVIIDRPSANVTVTHRLDPTTVRSLTSREGFILSFGELSLTGDSVLHAGFTFSGGSLAGAGNLTVYGAFVWSRGIMRGPGTTTVGAGGTLNVGGAVGMQNGRTLHNAGTVNFSATFGFFFDGDSSCVNAGTFLATAGFTLLGTGSTFTNQAGATFRSQGPVTVSGGSGVFHNHGRVEVESGTLTINVAGTVSGTYVVPAGTQLSFYGQQSTVTGATFTGAGAVRLGGYITLAGTLTGQHVEISADALSGTSTWVGTFTWSGGGLTGPGTTTLPAGSTLTITGSGLGGGHTFSNAGTVTVSGTGLGLQDPATTFHNLAGAMVQTPTGGQFSGNGAFHNAGTVRVQGGTLGIHAAGTHTGTFQTDAGATLSLSGSQNVRPEARFQGPGLVRLGQVSVGTVTLMGSHSLANLELAGGVLAIPGSLTVTGLFTWTVGELRGLGTTTIPSGATLEITGSVFKQFAGAHTIDNAGTILFSGVHVAFSYANGTINNLAGGVFRVDVQNPLQFFPPSSSGIFNNAGRVEVLRGRLDPSLPGGASNGTFHAAAGTRLSLPTPQTFGDGTAFTGPGTKSVVGRTTFAGSISGENVEFIGLEVRGTAALSGTYFWRGSSFTGSGTTTFTAGSTLTIDGAIYYRWLDGGHALHNAGTTILTADHELYMQDAGTTFVNLPGGVFQVPGTADITSGGATFTNAGALRVQSGTVYISAPFTNSGTVQVLGGTLHLLRFTNFANTTLTGGAYEVAGTLKFNGADIRTNAASIVLDGPASAVVNQSNANALANLATNAAAGAFTLRNGRMFSRTGAFSNAGAVAVEANSSFEAVGAYTQTAGRTTLAGGGISASFVDVQGGVLDGSGYMVGDLRNAGQLRVGGTGAAGYFFVIGGYTQTAAGALALEIGGLALGSEYDFLYVSGTATLDGTLSLALLNGFVPSPGDLLLSILYGGVSGDFATIDGLFFGKGRAFYPFHDDTGYYLWTYAY